MKFRNMVLIAVGVGLYALSNSLELRGDLAPLAASGVSGARLTYHLMALVVLLAGQVTAQQGRRRESGGRQAGAHQRPGECGDSIVPRPQAEQPGDQRDDAERGDDEQIADR